MCFIIQRIPSFYFSLRLNLANVEFSLKHFAIPWLHMIVFLWESSNTDKIINKAKILILTQITYVALAEH